MQDYREKFLRFVIDNDILRFGEFTLKSGRVSPYFFNAGLFNTGAKLGFLARSYAAAIADSGLDFAVMFGPAYKGIPLAAATALALSSEQSMDKPYCFNRKEAKSHGEGGQIVGAALEGEVLVIDDVITAGTAIREAVSLIESEGATLAGIVVAMDRQEKGQGEQSAIQEIEQQYGIRVISIITLGDIIDFLQGAEDEGLTRHLDTVRDYRARYGV